MIKNIVELEKIMRLEINLADRQCALALLLTPAENQWLVSELTIFLDRALRRQQIYRAALDRLTVDDN